MLEVEKSETFDRWFRRLRNRTVRLRIARQIYRMQVAERYLGDWKSVGEGVIEVRLDYGPGYRVYVCIENDRMLLLLAGGDKYRQQPDIEKAKIVLADWRRQNGRAV